jgi:hypothetical protein
MHFFASRCEQGQNQPKNDRRPPAENVREMMMTGSTHQPGALGVAPPPWRRRSQVRTMLRSRSAAHRLHASERRVREMETEQERAVACLVTTLHHRAHHIETTSTRKEGGGTYLSIPRADRIHSLVIGMLSPHSVLLLHPRNPDPRGPAARRTSSRELC